MACAKYPSSFVEAISDVALVNHSEMATSHAAWKGMVCLDCGRCNSRIEWDQWRCGIEGCDFEISIHHTVRPASALIPEHALEADGHAICFDKWEEPVIRTKVEFPGIGGSRLTSCFLATLSRIIHIIGNRAGCEDNEQRCHQSHVSWVTRPDIEGKLLTEEAASRRMQPILSY